MKLTIIVLFNILLDRSEYQLEYTEFGKIT